MMMQEDKDNKKSIQEKLELLKYNCGKCSHLIVNQKVCAKCKDKPCIFICPAGVYSKDEVTGEIIVQYENCLECGACRIACPKNTIDWSYPESGCGVVFKHN